MTPDAIARAAAERLAGRLGQRFPAAVERALTAGDTPASAAALDTIAAWLVRAARRVEAVDRGEPAAGVERLFAALDRPSGASPAIARAVLGEVIAAAVVEAA